MTLSSDPFVHSLFFDHKETFYIHNLPWQAQLWLVWRGISFLCFQCTICYFCLTSSAAADRRDCEQSFPAHLLRVTHHLIDLYHNPPTSVSNLLICTAGLPSLRITFVTWRKTGVFICMCLYPNECFFGWAELSEWSASSLTVPLSSLFIIISVLAKK